MKVDSLIMLLSTDWFMPHWACLGVEIDEVGKEFIQRGCREIVKQILSGAENYYLSSFSQERLSQTRSKLDSLVQQMGSESLQKVAEQWWDLSDEEQKAAWIYSTFTDELLSRQASQAQPNLDSVIVRTMEKMQNKYDIAPYDFLAISQRSDTSWDRYVSRLTPDLATALADTLAAFLTARRFEEFWNRLRDRLTPAQRENLASWYRDMAKFHGSRDIVPSYIATRVN